MSERGRWVVTDKQLAFANEYLIDLNATRAYKEVYKGVKSEAAAKAAASRLLTNVNVKNYIEQQMKLIKSKKIAEATEVMEYLTSVMRGEAKEEVAMIVSNGKQKTMQKIIKDVRHTDRIKAAELLGRRYALFTDKMQLDGEIGVQIIDDI